MSSVLLLTDIIHHVCRLGEDQRHVEQRRHPIDPSKARLALDGQGDHGLAVGSRCEPVCLLPGHAARNPAQLVEGQLRECGPRQRQMRVVHRIEAAAEEADATPDAPSFDLGRAYEDGIPDSVHEQQDGREEHRRAKDLRNRYLCHQPGALQQPLLIEGADRQAGGVEHDKAVKSGRSAEDIDANDHDEGAHDRLAEFVSADAVDHDPLPGTEGMPILEGLASFLDMRRQAFPDFKYTIEDVLAEGDKVIDALEGIDGFQMFSGPLKFTEEHTLSTGGFQILIAKDGEGARKQVGITVTGAELPLELPREGEGGLRSGARETKTTPIEGA